MQRARERVQPSRRFDLIIAQGFGFVALLGVATLAACASEETTSNRGLGTPPTSAGAAGNGARVGPMSGVPSGPGLGVSNPAGIVPPPMTAMPTDPMAPTKPEEECEPGKFCEPKGPDGNCGSERLNTDVKTIQIPGNLMVVFDRSTSMEDLWNGVPRWQAAGEAFSNAIKPLAMVLNVGAIFFPSPLVEADPNCPIGCNVADPLHWIPGPTACCLNGVQACGVNPIDQADQIKFGPASAFLTEAPMKWRFNGFFNTAPAAMGGAMMMPAAGAIVGATPLGEGVRRAAEAIMMTKFEGPLVVVILTDGEPNCDTDPQQVIQQVTTWQQQSIATHVIGLPGSQGASQFLTNLAMAGGTDNFLDPASAMELEMKLRGILTSTVRQGFESCVFHLDKATEVPDKLHLVITEGGADKDVPRDLSNQPNWGADAGWSISKEGDAVEIKGRLCELAKEGAYESIRFDYGCVELPPPDPPMGPA
jgi:hypothetical protein